MNAPSASSGKNDPKEIKPDGLRKAYKGRLGGWTCEVISTVGGKVSPHLAAPKGDQGAGAGA
jgi:hypothetical protein